MAAISELCAALEACLPFFYSPPDSDAASRRGDRLQHRLGEAASAAEASEWDEEERSRFCRLLGELGGAMAALASSPAARAAFEPGGESPALMVAGAQLHTACAVILECSCLAELHTISGGSDTFRWAQSWRLLAELGRRSVQSGLASASQPSGGASISAQARAAAVLLAGAGTQAPLQAVMTKAAQLLEAAQALLRMLRVPGSERTLAAFAGTTAASNDTVLLLAVTSTALSLCFQQGIGDADQTARLVVWAEACGALLAEPLFSRVQGLMRALPHMQAAIAGLLLHALPEVLGQLEAAADAGGAVSNMAARFTLRLLQLAGAPSLHAGLQQAFRQCSGGSGEAALGALAQVVTFGTDLGADPANLIDYPAMAVNAWGQVCAALAQVAPAEGASALHQRASQHSVVILPVLVQLAAAALQEEPASEGRGEAAASTATEFFLSSLAAAAQSAADFDLGYLLTEDFDKEATPLYPDSIANAAEAAIRLLHLAAERQAQVPAASADSGSGAWPGLSALLEAGAAAAVSCLGSLNMPDIEYMARADQAHEPGAGSEQVDLEQGIAQRLWLLHSTACRFLHYALGRPAELPRLLSDRNETGWEGFVSGINRVVEALTNISNVDQDSAGEEEEDESRPQAAGPIGRPVDDRTMQAVAVAHAEAMTAVLAAMESGSSHVPCEGQAADKLCCVVAKGVACAALLVTESSPGCPNVVAGSAAAMGTLCSALDRALRAGIANAAAAQASEGGASGDDVWVARVLAISACLRAATACPQLNAALLNRGLLSQLAEAAWDSNLRGSGLPPVHSDLNTVRTIVLGLVQACREAAAGSSTQTDAAAVGMHSTASTQSAQLDVPAAALAAAVATVPSSPMLAPSSIQTEAAMKQSRAAALSYFRETVLPTIQLLGEALDAFYMRPEQQAAAQLATAEVAAARSCAYLRCANVAAIGGPAAGEQLGSKRCGGCRAVRYCDTACSHADWRAGHLRVCKQLAAARLEAQQSTAATATAAASGEAE